MAGMATLTMVVSSRIMKNPLVRTTRTNHGLVRACAMTSPYHLVAGIDSDLPLQLAVDNFPFELAHPLALGVEHRDLVFHFDERQSRQSLPVQLSEHVFELRDQGIERSRTFVEVACGLGCCEVGHEHQAGDELRVLAGRLAEQLPKGAGQHLLP